MQMLALQVLLLGVPQASCCDDCDCWCSCWLLLVLPVASQGPVVIVVVVAVVVAVVAVVGVVGVYLLLLAIRFTIRLFDMGK